MAHFLATWSSTRALLRALLKGLQGFGAVENGFGLPPNQSRYSPLLFLPLIVLK